MKPQIIFPGKTFPRLPSNTKQTLYSTFTRQPFHPVLLMNKSVHILHTIPGVNMAYGFALFI